MIASTTTLPWQGTTVGFRRFTVPEYHRMIEIGLLTENDDVELLEGYLVHKMARNAPHDGTIQCVEQALREVLPGGWCLRTQSAVTLADSEPEPDIVVARGNHRSFLARHPRAEEIAIVVEVADSTLQGDRTDKSRIYARAKLPCYWIVNIVDRRVEVREQPSGPTASPCYSTLTEYSVEEKLPVIMDGIHIASIAVADMLP